jgi:hypothetical protein
MNLLINFWFFYQHLQFFNNDNFRNVNSALWNALIHLNFVIKLEDIDQRSTPKNVDLYLWTINERITAGSSLTLVSDAGFVEHVLSLMQTFVRTVISFRWIYVFSCCLSIDINIHLIVISIHTCRKFGHMIITSALELSKQELIWSCLTMQSTICDFHLQDVS